MHGATGIQGNVTGTGAEESAHSRIHGARFFDCHVSDAGGNECSVVQIFSAAVPPTVPRPIGNLVPGPHNQATGDLAADNVSTDMGATTSAVDGQGVNEFPSELVELLELHDDGFAVEWPNGWSASSARAAAAAMRSREPPAKRARAAIVQPTPSRTEHFSIAETASHFFIGEPEASQRCATQVSQEMRKRKANSQPPSASTKRARAPAVEAPPITTTSWRATVKRFKFGQGHNLRQSGMLIWCKICGRFGEERFREDGLGRKCSGDPGQYATQLNNLRRAQHPYKDRLLPLDIPFVRPQ